jgi:hypothetical protein
VYLQVHSCSPMVNLTELVAFGPLRSLIFDSLNWLCQQDVFQARSVIVRRKKHIFISSQDPANDVSTSFSSRSVTGLHTYDKRVGGMNYEGKIPKVPSARGGSRMKMSGRASSIVTATLASQLARSCQKAISGNRPERTMRYAVGYPMK